MQLSEMLLYALNLRFFILGFAIYPVAYGVGFTLQGLPIDPFHVVRYCFLNNALSLCGSYDGT